MGGQAVIVQVEDSGKTFQALLNAPESQGQFPEFTTVRACSCSLQQLQLCSVRGRYFEMTKNFLIGILLVIPSFVNENVTNLIAFHSRTYAEQNFRKIYVYIWRKKI